MAGELSRRAFVGKSVLASAGAALAMGATDAASAEPAPAAAKNAPAPKDALPKGRIGDLEISRILLGGNLLTHFTHARDLRYTYNLAKHYNTDEKVLETIALAEAHGINALVIHTAPNVLKLQKQYREKHGGKMQWIICSIADIEKPAEYDRAIGEMIDAGTDAIYIWGVHADKLAKEGKVGVIGRAVQMVKSHGVLCGVGGHELQVVQECEKAKIPADFYIKTFHHHNYPSAKLNYDSSWCSNPEETRDFMKNVQKPWIAFKVMAAGAIPPADAFKYVFENGADFSLAGMFDFEIAEDVQIAKQVLAGVRNRARPWRG